MKLFSIIVIVCLSALMITAPLAAQTPSAAPSLPKTPVADKPAAASQPSPATPAPTTPDRAVCRVNGKPIMDSEVVKAIRTLMAQRMPAGIPIPDAQIAQVRQSYGDAIIDMLIEISLLDQEAEKAGIKVTDAELVQKDEQELQAYLSGTGTTREEFEQQMQAKRKMSVKEFMAVREADPAYKQSITHERLLEKKFPEDLKVADEEIAAQYQKDLDQVFKRPELVRASHILIKTDEMKTDEEKAAAKKKIEGILTETKQPGADFAALAKKYSDCPSKEEGGDLDFFPREGAMVKAFADAAFAMKVGTISDIVETNFGYHIIKVTDRKPESTITIEKAKDYLRTQLRAEKEGKTRNQFVEELKKTAKIEKLETTSAPARPKAPATRTSPAAENKAPVAPAEGPQKDAPQKP